MPTHPSELLGDPPCLVMTGIDNPTLVARELGAHIVHDIHSPLGTGPCRNVGQGCDTSDLADHSGGGDGLVAQTLGTHNCIGDTAPRGDQEVMGTGENVQELDAGGMGG